MSEYLTAQQARNNMLEAQSLNGMYEKKKQKNTDRNIKGSTEGAQYIDYPCCRFSCCKQIKKT